MSMTNTHTTACGTEPFDKNYCIGYQVHHEDWSPFPRVNHLRQTFLDGKYWIDIERLRLVTETYQKYEDVYKRQSHTGAVDQRDGGETDPVSSVDQM